MYSTQVNDSLNDDDEEDEDNVSNIPTLEASRSRTSRSSLSRFLSPVSPASLVAGRGSSPPQSPRPPSHAWNAPSEPDPRFSSSNLSRSLQENPDYLSEGAKNVYESKTRMMSSIGRAFDLLNMFYLSTDSTTDDDVEAASAAASNSNSDSGGAAAAAASTSPPSRLSASRRPDVNEYVKEGEYVEIADGGNKSTPSLPGVVGTPRKESKA
jgi:hypothetical protein